MNSASYSERLLLTLGGGQGLDVEVFWLLAMYLVWYSGQSAGVQTLLRQTGRVSAVLISSKLSLSGGVRSAQLTPIDFESFILCLCAEGDSMVALCNNLLCQSVQLLLLLQGYDT